MKLYLNCSKPADQVTWTKADYLLAAAKDLGVDVEWYHGEEAVDYVLNIEPFDNFVKGNKWTGIWEIDVLCDRQQMNESNWTVADEVFVAVGTVPNRLYQFRNKTTLLFQACDPDLHRRIPSIEQKYDFVFSGSVGLSIYEERERIMSVMRTAGFTFQDFGKGHTPQKYIEKINEAKVQFIRSMKTPIGDGELAQRFFECLAIGPVLTNWVPDLRHTGLIDGEDYLSYKDDVEMLKRMRLFIFDDNFRQTVAENGRKKALLYHTYQHRLVSILGRVKEHGK